MVITGGYPGPLRDILGIWVEESDALPEGTENQFSYKGKEYPARILCDLLHLEGARSLVEYEKDFYSGFPALTCHGFGRGKAYYAACRSSREFYLDFLEDVCRQEGIDSLTGFDRSTGLPEVTERHNENGSFLFLLNHGEERAAFLCPADGRELLGEAEVRKGERLEIGPKDVKIIKMAGKEEL